MVENEVLLGYIDTEVLSNIDRENWANTQVGDVFVELDGSALVAPDLPAQDVMARVAETGRRKFLVVEDHKLKGVVTLSDLAHFIGLLTELKLRPTPRKPT